MCQAHPTLAKKFWVRDHLKLIKCRDNESTIQIVACSGNVSGFNGDVVCDELAEWPPSVANQVWSKIQNAGAARMNSALLTISTANYNMGEHPGYAQYLWAKEVLNDPAKDPSLLPIVHECPLDQWETEQGWRAANPSIGYTLDLEELREDYQRCVNNPRELNRFKMLRLGIWCGSNELFLDPQKWEACREPFNEQDLYGLEAFGALDLSRRHDLSCWCLIVPKGELVYLLPRFFTPKELVSQKEKSDGVPYRKWHEQGLIHFSPGDTIDHGYLADIIRQDATHFDISSIRFDPWNADQLAKMLRGEGFKMVEVPQSSTAMAPATGEFERLVLKARVRHNHPILDWNVTNAVVRRVGQTGIVINKAKSTARIDGVVASIIGIGAYMESRDKQYVDVNSVFGV